MNKKPDETIDPEKRLGEILKTERLKRGLSYEQIFELTKLRPSIIDALENEEWDKLPPSVFVKGFIKSYAQTLNLDPNSIIDLYNKTDHSKKGYMIVQKHKTKRSIIIWIPFVVIIITIIFLVILSIKKRHTLKNEIKPKIPKISKMFTIYVDENINFPAILEAKIKKRTWLRIIVDKYRPETYLLEPGEYISWQVRYGFELIAGDSGSIELWLNHVPVHFNKRDGYVLCLRLYSKKYKNVNKI